MKQEHRPAREGIPVLQGGEEVNAQLLEDPAEFISLVKFDWLVSKTWNRLHWAEIGEQYWPGIAMEWAVTEPIRLACGRTAAAAFIPGMFTRMGAERCKGCCRALGYPAGRGSPKNDDACRVILGLPADGGAAGVTSAPQ